MAKGKKSKKGSGSAKASKKKKTEEEKRNGEKKVSDDEETAEDDDEVEEQEWDLICIIPKTDRSKIDCAGGCTKKACSGWATKENPQDIWYGCKTCAEEECGGAECWEGCPPSDEEGDDATASGETPPTTGEESRSTVDKDSNEGDEPDDKFSSPNSNKDDPETTAAEALVAMEEVVSQQQPEESSHAEATTEGRSKDTSKDEVDISAKVDDVPVTPGMRRITLESEDSPSHEEDEEEVPWEIAKIISIDDILNNPIVCEDEGCKEEPMPLPACVIQVPVNNRNKKFYSCLDCYNNTYAWEEEEMPKDQVHLTEEHRRVMAQNCSREENPALPIFSDSGVAAAASADKNKNALTPPPPSQTGKKKNGKPLVTPSPHPLTATTGNNGGKKEKAKPSSNLTAMNEKWQKEATKLGGPNAKIVVQIPAAKKIVYDTCFDAFKPQNLTSLHQVRGIILYAVFDFRSSPPY